MNNDPKRCSSCGETKPLGGNFYRDKSKACGWGSTCIPCMKARLGVWREDNPEQSRQIVQRYRRTAKARARACEHSRTFRRTERATVNRSNDSARRRGAIGVITIEHWGQILEYFGHRCAYCNAQPERLGMDHIIPVTKGGVHMVGNVVPACTPCNRRKAARSLPQLLELRG